MALGQLDPRLLPSEWEMTRFCGWSSCALSALTVTPGDGYNDTLPDTTGDPPPPQEGLHPRSSSVQSRGCLLTMDK